jgi:hypothetical protein
MRGDFWTQRGGESLNVLALDNCDSMDVQFPDVVTFSEEMANRGKVVIVAALDGAFMLTSEHIIHIWFRKFRYFVTHVPIVAFRYVKHRLPSRSDLAMKNKLN